jgi:hypothetical protein
VRRLWIALAAIAGFAIVFMSTWVVGIWQNQDAECDGVCVDMFPIIGALALVLGVLGALAAGFVASAILDRYFARPS